MSDARRPWRVWWPVWAWAIVQLTATSVPGQALPSTGAGVDYVAHCGMYGVQAFLLWRGFTLTQRAKPGLAVWLVVALSGFGILDEAHQLLIPGRDASVLDWLFDTAGATAGMWAGVTIMRTRLAAWLT